MAENINHSEARELLKIIFNECGQIQFALDPKRVVSYDRFWEEYPDVVNAISANVINVLNGNFNITPQFNQWFQTFTGDINTDAFERKEYREALLNIWKQIMVDRAGELSSSKPKKNETASGKSLPRGWAKESADLYIGPHGINLPGPEAISVYEDFGISGANSLRTDADPIWREPRARIDFTIDTIYPNASMMNAKLRPLVAFLRACPLTVVQSELLNRVMLRKLQEEGLFARLAAAQKDWDANKDRVKEMLEDLGVYTDATLADLKSQLSTEGEIGRQVARIAKIYSPPPADGTIPGPLQRVPAMFTGLQVQSIPDAVHAYRVRFSFTLMNDLAVSADGLRFLDATGNETDSIWESAWLRRYVDMGWLDDEKKDTYLPEYPPDGAKMKFEYDSEMAPFAVDPVVEDGKDIIIEGVACSWQNKVAQIPLLGQEVPSCQYLGRGNATVDISMNCTVKGIEKITRVKSSIEKNVHSNIKADRRDRLGLVMPMPNMLGFKDFIITRVQTQTENNATDRFRVLVTLVENSVKIRDRETLLLNNNQMTRTVAKSLWDYLWSVYDGHLNFSSSREQAGEYEYIRGLLFGNNPDRPLEGCLLNYDVLRAATWGDEYIREFLGEFWKDIKARENRPDLNLGEYFEPRKTEVVFYPRYKLEEYEFWNMDHLLFECQQWIAGGKSRDGIWLNPMPTMEAKAGALRSFLDKWRLMVESKELDRNGHEEIDTPLFVDIASKLKYQLVIVKQKMRDTIFNAIWDRENPSNYESMDREHRNWAIERDRYIAARPSEMKEAARAAFERENPKTKIDEAPSLWNRARVQDAFRTLHMIAANMPGIFPLWKINGKSPMEYIDQHVGLPVSRYDPSQKNYDYRSLSCYPDFELPTYRQLFTYAEGLNPVWVRFAPAASSLGLTDSEIGTDPTLNDDSEPIGVGLDDLVEPTFYFSTGRYQRQASHIEAELISNEVIFQATRGLSFVEVDLTFDDLNQKYPQGPQVSHLHQLIGDLIKEDGDEKNRNVRAKNIFKQLENGEIPEVRLTTSDDIVIAVARKDPNDLTDKHFNIVPIRGKGRGVMFMNNSANYDLEKPEKVREVLKQVMQSTPEDKQDVKRCFPTFRLRFIDFDLGLYTDEFYDYNAVKSIHIFHDKYDASTCELEIMNLTGVLDNDVFFTSAEERDLGIPADDEAKTVSDERAGRHFKAIKLREGTSIQVLMGYSPDPNKLKTVFNGRISQVQMGQIVTIIAQGYKTELLNEVSFKSEDESWTELVRRTFQHLDGEGHKEEPSEIRIDERKNGTPHLGNRIDLANETQRREYNAIMIDLFGPNNLIYGSGAYKWVGPFGVDFAKIYQSPDFADYTVDGRNYIDLFSVKPSRYRNITLKSFINDKKDFWLASYQPAFDVLQEITSFMPGWICDVVDYDHLATLYIGPPEGDYFWTSKFNRDVIANYRKPYTQSDHEKTEKILGLFERFADYAYEWIRRKRWESVRIPEYSGSLDTGKYKGPLLESWLPDEFNERNMAGVIGALREQHESVFRALVGAFFGFDLVTKDDFPPQISRAMWAIINRIVGYDGRTAADGLRLDWFGGDIDDIALDWGESAQRYIEYIAENTVGFNSKMYQLSHFRNSHLQKAVGRIAYLKNSPYASTSVEINSLQDVTYYERLRTPEVWVTLSEKLNPYFDINKLSDDELMERRGIDYRTGINLLNLLNDKKYRGIFYNIMMYPPRSFKETLNKLIPSHTTDFKVFLYLVYKYLTNELRDEDVAAIGSDIAEYKTLFKTPDRKPFRSYHLVTSRYDLIANNIIATTKEMANAILLRHPGGEPNIDEAKSPVDGAPKLYSMDEGDTNWTVFKHPDGVSYHPKIRLEQKKLAVVIAKNATTKEQAAPVFLSKMGEALRPMYRGNIVMWGRPVRPHDVIFINDEYNAMTGPVEAERVIHHFTPQTGWTTTVVPHALVHVDNSIDIFQASVIEKWFRAISIGLDVADIGLIIIAIISLGGGAAVKAMGNRTLSMVRGALKSAIAKALAKKVAADTASAATATATTTAAAAATTGVATTEVAKMAGTEISAMVKNGIRSIAVYGALGIGQVVINGYTNNLISSGSDKLQGIVSITPLIYEGRPLVAGLDYDDSLYLSQFDNAWEYFTDKFDKATKFITETVPELFSPTERRNDEFEPAGPRGK